MIGVGIIGSGSIALANHLPGLRLCKEARLIAVCDVNPATVERAKLVAGVSLGFTDYRELLRRDDVNAVIVATPNDAHPPIVIDACRAGKHVLCEKPLAVDLAGAVAMLNAAREAHVRHMTAFTYRFVPAMRYLHHLVATGALGEIRHFRAQRFQDWQTRPLGWRQLKMHAGTGELGDMLSHRIDYGHHLVGKFARLVADMRVFVSTRGGETADVDDWVSMLGDFRSGATGVLESTKLATGRGEGHRGLDLVELNGSEASAVYSTQTPLELQFGKAGAAELSRIEVPRQFWVYPGSPRDPDEGDPLATFRYDQDVEFIRAIVEQRECDPSFRAGVECQAVMDGIVQSATENRWVELSY